jgi:hypothetical protein
MRAVVVLLLGLSCGPARPQRVWGDEHAARFTARIYVLNEITRGFWGDVNKSVRTELWVRGERFIPEGSAFFQASVSPQQRAAVVARGGAAAGVWLLVLRPGPELIQIAHDELREPGAWLPDGSAYIVGQRGWFSDTGEEFSLPRWSGRFLDLSPDLNAVVAEEWTDDGPVLVVSTAAGCTQRTPVSEEFGDRFRNWDEQQTIERYNLRARERLRWRQTDGQWEIELIPAVDEE